MLCLYLQTLHDAAVEQRRERDGLVDDLQAHILDVERRANEATGSHDVETLDRTFEVSHGHCRVTDQHSFVGSQRSSRWSSGKTAIDHVHR